MEQVLISIRPEWVEKILNGEKNAEVRLNVPKCELPCEVFIYCTKGGKKLQGLNGKAVAKFILNETEHLSLENIKIFESYMPEYRTCVPDKEMQLYSKGKDIDLWLMDSLEVFDTPKELSDFYKNGTYTENDYMFICSPVFSWSAKDIRSLKRKGILDIKSSYQDYLKTRVVTHAPQSWCYVKENKNVQ